MQIWQKRFVINQGRKLVNKGGDQLSVKEGAILNYFKWEVKLLRGSEFNKKEEKQYG